MRLDLPSRLLAAALDRRQYGGFPDAGLRERWASVSATSIGQLEPRQELLWRDYPDSAIFDIKTVSISFVCFGTRSPLKRLGTQDIPGSYFLERYEQRHY
jgi:hypothetical protein